jgi:hypothetical protein
MALQASGNPISFNDIQKEFGLPPGRNLGAYRVSQTVGGLTRPLDDDIPTSGTIRFSDFYGKKLNVVVNYTSSTTITRVNARSDYNANNSRNVVIGNFRSRPASSSNKKIWIHTNGTIGSNANTADPPNRTYCSLRTGSWDSNTELILDIGSNGIVIGSGGNGGKGGNATTSGREAGKGANLTAGERGKNGTSAIGIEYTPIVLRNRGGIIRSGRGGGGGGGAAFGNDRDANVFNETTGRQTRAASGSGGGGGRGIPAGTGGSGGDAGPNKGSGEYTTRVVEGNSGNNGTILNGGRGGDSVFLLDRPHRAAGGAGGGGSQNGESGTQAPSPATGTDGTDGTADQGGTGGNGYSRQDDGAGRSDTLGESGGLSGYAIIANASSSEVDIQNTGEISGDQIYDTSPT